MRDATAGPARVVSVGRNAAWIVFDDERVPRPAGIPKRLARLSLVTGDRVWARPLEEGRALIERREERAFALLRRTPGGRNKTMAANIDTLAIVTAFDRPPLHLPMVDELLAFGELHELSGILIFTKPDLAQRDVLQTVPALYQGLGYAVMTINPKARTGVEAVAHALETRHSLLIGQSGVGKSSLFRALGGDSAVGDVSASGRGRQTTTSARLHRFRDGFFIDSPGVGDFALRPAEGVLGYEWFAEVAYGFREFRPLGGTCRFRDCTHRREPDCAVRSAVASGTVAASRYESYVFITARETER
ncbi:MAG: ribosome small subunit-dependent GTPase A [Candidatus Eremiobacteraeota bacterium]|nr:ribosome small subunit-dependent GTPase A [Candidatus Eremiobacteraeota bacterium]